MREMKMEGRARARAQELLGDSERRRETETSSQERHWEEPR
jgi:hypothetical protein